MTALDQDKNTPERTIIPNIAAHEYPLNATAELFVGALACLNASGELVAGTTSSSLIAVGRVEAYANGADGDERGKVKAGVFRFDNGSDSIASSDKGSVCYIVDDQTVHLTDGGGTRSKAGVIVDVDDDGVWVAVGFAFFSNPAATPSGTLQKKTVTVTDADLTGGVDGTADTINVGTALPAGAMVVAVLLTLDTQFTGGGAAAETVDVGWSGALEALVKDFDAFGSTAGGAEYSKGASAGTLLPNGPVAASGKQILATFTPDGSTKGTDFTAGSLTIDVFYFVAF